MDDERAALLPASTRSTAFSVCHELTATITTLGFHCCADVVMPPRPRTSSGAQRAKKQQGFLYNRHHISGYPPPAHGHTEGRATSWYPIFLRTHAPLDGSSCKFWWRRCLWLRTCCHRDAWRGSCWCWRALLEAHLGVVGDAPASGRGEVPRNCCADLGVFYRGRVLAQVGARPPCQVRVHTLVVVCAPSHTLQARPFCLSRCNV